MPSTQGGKEGGREAKGSILVPYIHPCTIHVQFMHQAPAQREGYTLAIVYGWYTSMA